MIGDVLAAEGEDTAAAITAEGGRCLFVRADVSQEQDCARLMAAAVEHSVGSTRSLRARVSCGAHFRM